MKKILLVTLIAFLTFQLRAQDNATFELTLNHLALSVKDVNRAAEFYGGVLKFPEITNKTKVDGIRWFSLGEGKELHLISTIKENVLVNRAVHLAMTTPNFDAFVQTLDKMKVTYSDWPGVPNKINIRADGIKQIFFQDPDGYWIEVNSVNQK
jgi:lactoylglutathione lyase